MQLYKEHFAGPINFGRFLIFSGIVKIYIRFQHPSAAINQKPRKNKKSPNLNLQQIRDTAYSFHWCRDFVLLTLYFRFSFLHARIAKVSHRVLRYPIGKGNNSLEKKIDPGTSKLFRFCSYWFLIFQEKWYWNTASFHLFKSGRNEVAPTLPTPVANGTTPLPLSSCSSVDMTRAAFRAGFDFNDLIRIWLHWTTPTIYIKFKV